MKFVSLCLALTLLCGVSLAQEAPQTQDARSVLYYQGHASLRITTAEGKIIYIDPYTGDGYDQTADLILVTHDHSDHNQVSKIKHRSADCRLITRREALAGGEHQTFELGYVTVTAVQAGNNANHSVKSCVGYLLTFADGVKLYVSGDTSKTEQMAQLADEHIDYAFFCCDGVYNMGLKEAAACANLVAAKHTIPYHYGMNAKMPSDETLSALGIQGLLVLPAGGTLTLE